MKLRGLFAILLTVLLLLGVLTVVAAADEPTAVVDPEGAAPAPDKLPEAPAAAAPAAPAGVETSLVSEGFESATFPPTGWGQTQVVGTYNWDRVTSGSSPTISPHGGTAMARWNCYSIAAGNQTRLWTPAFSLVGASSPVLDFYMSHDSGYSTAPYDRVTVQVSTDGTNWTDLGTIDRYDAACTTACWKLHSFDLSTYVGQAAVQIGFLGISQYGNNIFLDDVLVAYGPNLSTSYKSAPAQVAVGDPIPYVVHIVNTGTGAATNATLNDVIPTGVTYVAGSVDCSAGTCGYASGTVTWTGTVPLGGSVVVSFTVDTDGVPCGNVVNTVVLDDPNLGGSVSKQATTMVAYTLPLLTESFDTLPFPPTGWGQAIVNDPGTDPVWTRETAGTYPTILPHSGAAMTKFNSFSAPALASARLYTPVIDLSTAAPPVTFWMSHDTNYSTAPYDRVTVQISTTGTTWTDLGTINRYDATCTTPCWKQHSFDLSSYLGQTNVRIGFLGTSQYGYNFFIDDVKIGEPWSPCPYVTLDPNQNGGACRGGTVDYELTAANITSAAETYGLSASFTWPTTVDPTSLSLASLGSDTVAISVHIPWAADAGDNDTATVVATGQTNGLTDQALLQTTAALAAGYTDYADVPSTDGYLTRDHSVVYLDGKLYKIGGYGGATGAARAFVLVYDIATNTWAVDDPLPAARYWIDCVAISGKIYCAGGYTTSAQSTLYIYDPTAAPGSRWTTGTALPAARYGYTGVALNGLYYVIGGYTTSYQNTMIVYDPATGLWDSSRASMSVPRRYAAGGAIGGQIYVAGGLTSGTTYTLSSEMYDPVTNTWSPKADLPANSPFGTISGWVRGADGVKHDRYLVWAGGSYVDSGATNAVLVYDSVNNSWAFQPYYMPHVFYSAEGDTDGDGNFWFVSGRIYEGAWGYSRYTTRLEQCSECTPVSGADYTVDPTSPRPSNPATFTGSVAAGSPPITWAWSFGDNTYGSGQVVNHTYAATGDYTVVMTATNCDGVNTSVATHVVTVEAGPLIEVTPSALESTQCPDVQVTKLLTICNNGDQPLTWSIVEVAPGGRAIAGSMPFVPVNVKGPAVEAPITVSSPGGRLVEPERSAHPEAVLWDQPLSAVNPNAYVDQDFPDIPTFSSFLADDFVNPATWTIDTIFVPGDGWNGFTSLLSATSLTWQIYADNAGVPAGDPSGGGSPPVWTLTLAPTDAQVTVSNGSSALPSNTLLQLAAPISLPPGHWWLVFYPTMPFVPTGQYGRQPADTINGYVGQFINPGGGFGLGTAWQPWTVLSVPPQPPDIAFRLEGTSDTSPIPWVSEDPIAGTVAAAACETVEVTFDSTGMEPGTYTGTLQINNNDILNPVVNVPLTMIVAGPPTGVEFSWTPLTPFAGQEVTFNGTATALLPIAYGWDFGDGAYGTGQNPTHTYAAAGTYTVIMTATQCGFEVAAAHTITVLPPSLCEPLVQDFEGTFPPAGWTVVNNGGTCVWQRNDQWGTARPNTTGGTGFCADADSDECGSGTTMNTELRTSVFSLFGTTAPALFYRYDYNDLGVADQGTVDISTDGGTTWTNLVTYLNDDRGPAYNIVDLSAYAGQVTVQLRFTYVAPGWDWWFQVDDVMLVCQPMPDIAVDPTSLTQTLRVDQTAAQTFNIANVGLGPLDWTLDEGCGTPVGWLSESPISGTVPINGDTDVTATFNSTGLALGTYQTTVCVDSNDPDEPSVPVEVTLIVTGTPDIAVTPASLEAALCQDETDVMTVTICNEGDGVLAWSLSEVQAGLAAIPAATGVALPLEAVSIPLGPSSPAIADSGVSSGTPVAGMPANSSRPDDIGDAWEVMAPLPSARVFNAVVAAGSYIYVIGGTSDAGGLTPTDTNFRYNTGDNTWSTMAPMPAALAEIDGIAIGGLIYIPGSDPDSNTYVYDTAGNTWSAIPANGGYAAPVQYQVVAIGTDLYVLGGIISSASTPNVWVLDTTTGTWTAGVPMLKSRTSFSAAAVNGNIYVAGGVAFPGFTPDMTAEMFSGIAWSYIASVPNGGGAYTRWSYNADGMAPGALWLAAGRRDAGWAVLNHAGYYDVATDTWTDSPTIPVLNQGRVYTEGDVASDGYFYVIGGRDSAGAIVYADNERLMVYSPDAVPWLSEDPIAGTVPAGECVDVAVTFDSTGLDVGEYVADLVITSNDPDTPEVTIPVEMTVLEPATIADVTYTTNGLEVTFDATATGAAPLTFAWDFGDGYTSNLEDPVHTYAETGCYAVTLTVSNGCGEATWSAQVCVESLFLYYYVPIIFNGHETPWPPPDRR
jgi:uncharacterized repeat protein (TIGR01451 family)